MNHRETVASRNATRQQKPQLGGANNPQIEAAKKAHLDFESLPEIAKQRLRWEEKERDPLLMGAAVRIIRDLVPMEFDSAELEQKYTILRNYFEAAALKIGYKNTSPKGAYRLNSRYRYEPDQEQILATEKAKVELLERAHDEAVQEKSAIQDELHDQLERGQKLEAELKKAKDALAEKKKELKKKPAAGGITGGRKKPRKNTT